VACEGTWEKDDWMWSAHVVDSLFKVCGTGPFEGFARRHAALGRVRIKRTDWRSAVAAGIRLFAGGVASTAGGGGRRWRTEAEDGGGGRRWRTEVEGGGWRTEVEDGGGGRRWRTEAAAEEVHAEAKA
jgi:hypothetical protein